MDRDTEQIGLLGELIIDYQQMGTFEERNRTILSIAHDQGVLIWWDMDASGTATIEINGIRQDWEYDTIPAFVIGAVRALQLDVLPHNYKKEGLLSPEEQATLNRRAAGLRRRKNARLRDAPTVRDGQEDPT